MERALRIVDVVAPAQGIKAVLLPWVEAPGKSQGIGDLAKRGRILRSLAQAAPLCIKKADVEGCIVNNHFRTA